MIWLEHHGNRLYGVIGLLSKKSDEWMDWMDTPQTVMTTSGFWNRNKFSQHLLNKEAVEARQIQWHAQLSLF